MSPEAFASAVIGWYHRHGRKHLPWQAQVSPYRVWLSEIMLQQTQVATVIDYFQRFTQALPDLPALAAASEDEVLHLWTGLGYYSRARNLHKTARLVVDQYQGQLPRNLEALMALPGIGRSTAGAIASLAMGIRAPILDGNVKRVLTRYVALPGYPGHSQVANQLWELADRLTPAQDFATYTQAMMDLGATLCTRSRPNCPACPLQADCKARQLDQQQDFPQPRASRALPHRRTLMPLLTLADGRVLLYRRPSTGLWGGLWSLPQLDSLAQLPELAEQHRLSIGQRWPLPSLTHTFSHFKLDIEPWRVSVKAACASLAKPDWLWYDPGNPPRLGLAAPIKTLLWQLPNTPDPRSNQ